MPLKPTDPLTIRAFKRAVAYCNLMDDAEMSLVMPGSASTPEAMAWRAEGMLYERRLAEMQHEGKKGHVGKQVASPRGAANIRSTVR